MGKKKKKEMLQLLGIGSGSCWMFLELGQTDFNVAAGKEFKRF